MTKFLSFRTSKTVKNELLEIVRGNHLKVCIGIGFGKMFRDRDLFLGVVLELESGKNAVAILHIVNLFLLMSTPEITVAPQLVVSREFNPLADGEVFPQSAAVGP